MASDNEVSDVLFDVGDQNITTDRGNVGVDMKHLNADFSAVYNRKSLPEIDEQRDLFWKRKLVENPSLYNASKFRIKNIELTNYNGENGLLLRIGLTDYKDFVCTNSNSEIRKLIFEEGKLRYGDKHACMSDALGICAVIMTSDDFVLFVKRSFVVFEAQGMADFPGGHSEPEEMFKKCGGNNQDLSKIEGYNVMYEIFHSVIREIKDEINIPESALSWPTLLCILRNGSVGWKPHMSFFVKCSLSKDEIKSLYAIGGPEAEESSDILFVDIKELRANEVSQTEQRLGRMSACGLKTLEIFLKRYEQMNTNRQTLEDG